MKNERLIRYTHHPMGDSEVVFMYEFWRSTDDDGTYKDILEYGRSVEYCEDWEEGEMSFNFLIILHNEKTQSGEYRVNGSIEISNDVEIDDVYVTSSHKYETHMYIAELRNEAQILGIFKEMYNRLNKAANRLDKILPTDKVEA